MKKVSKNVLLIVLGGVLSFAVNVAAETLIDSGAVTYSNSRTSATTVDGALDELFSAVDINERLGNTDISTIGDGTLTGAINTLNTNLTSIGTLVANLKSDFTTLINDYIIINEVTIPEDGLYLLNNIVNLYKKDGERCMLMTRVDRNGSQITAMAIECSGGAYKGASLPYFVNLLKGDKVYALIYTDTSTSQSTTSLLQAVKLTK